SGTSTQGRQAEWAVAAWHHKGWSTVRPPPKQVKTRVKMLTAHCENRDDSDAPPLPRGGNPFRGTRPPPSDRGPVQRPVRQNGEARRRRGQRTNQRRTVTMRASTCSWVASASLGPPHSRRRLACTCECGIPLVRAYCATSELSSLRLLARARCSATVGSARSRRSWRSRRLICRF